MDPMSQSGALRHQGGAGFPPSEGIPSTFQVQDVSGTATWRVGTWLGQRATWSTPLILAWPQVKNEFAADAMPRRWPGFTLSGEIIGSNLMDTDIAHYWRASWDIRVSSSVDDHMTSIFGNYLPTAHQELMNANMTFFWTFAPSPKYVQVVLEFSNTRIEADELESISVKAEIRPNNAGWQP